MASGWFGTTPPNMWPGLIAWTCEYGGGGRGGWLARHGTSTRWARLIARTFGHGHRAVCGGGHHLEVVEEELALADICLHIRQTPRAPENVNRANMESLGGGIVWDSR